MMDLIHSGVAHDDNPPGRGSGRYGYGTGENPYQHQYDFIAQEKKLKAQGIPENMRAKMLLGEKAKSIDLRAELTIAKNQIDKGNIQTAMKLYEKTGSYSEVGRLMGKNESSVRTLLKRAVAEKQDRYTNTAEMLKEACKKQGGMIDVSKYSELYLGVPKHTLDVAVAMLEKEGYLKSYTSYDQLGTNNKTNLVILAEPGLTHKDVYQNRYNIKGVVEFTPDTGKTWWAPEFPESVDSKRIYVRYAEDGGVEKDGVIELRKGVEDISLGGSKYAQVRVAVDGTHYMKGMAVYGEDIPDGYDIVYNTNKKRGTPMKDGSAVYNPEDGTWSGKEVLKRMKIDNKTGEVDRDNPFGALIKSPKDRDGEIMPGGQRHYTDENGNDKLSPINKLQDEGDWDSWSRNLASQFLSKQPLKLINQQIKVSTDQKKQELDEILKLTNPVVKKRLLEDFADGCDANADDLSVKGFKNQAFQVLLPIPQLKDDEIYAPRFQHGDTVALVRYPHGGIFEIPKLKVNNKNEHAKAVMENATDAVGINQHVAEILSGADFDGDTALVIPMRSNGINISSSKPLDGLKNFDPKALYKLPDDAPWMSSKTKGIQMGVVTNLITDMTVAGASDDDICRAVRHSMVVIDAQKHHLDYKQSAKDNDIDDLKRRYQGVNKQGKPGGGASTVLSRASAKVKVDKLKETVNTKDMTPEELKRWNEGKKVWRPVNEKKKKLISDPAEMTSEERELYNAGKKVYRVTNENRQEDRTRMSLVDDAMELVRDPSNAKEVAYAKYANELKSLANQARKEYRSIKPTPVNKESRDTYSKEVASLMDKLRNAELNNPKERMAQAIANGILSQKLADNPGMDVEHKKRAASVALSQGRAMVGAKKDKIDITDEEWEAIQANAISNDRLSRIVQNSDIDKLKQRATPRNSGSLSSSQEARIKQMVSTGLYTQGEIANILGVSASTVSKIMRETS